MILFHFFVFTLMINVIKNVTVAGWIAGLGKHIAGYSYSMYVIHFSTIFVITEILSKVQLLVQPGFNLPNFALFLFCFIAVNSFSWAFSLFTEKYTRQVRAYFINILHLKKYRQG